MVIINEDITARFRRHLENREFSPATITKHMRNLRILTDYAGNQVEDKKHLNGFRDDFRRKDYSSGTINSILGTVNKLFRFMKEKGLCAEAWRLRCEKVQRQLFAPSKKALTREEYERMVRAAYRCGKKRLAALLQTICATGIRVSELSAITVESLGEGEAVIFNKGKERIIPLPPDLVKMLRCYCAEAGVDSGPIFVSRRGNPLDRSNIWLEMKQIAQEAEVPPEKVFPHNLRRLFARTYYDHTKSLARLADLLGHSSVDTTRIYTAASSGAERKKMNELRLVLRP